MRRAALIVGCAIVAMAAMAAPAAPAESLRELPAGARATVTQRIEPPIAQLPFACTSRRTQGAPLRDFLVREQAQAIEALAASADTPADTARVQRLLQQLQRFGTASDAEAWLRERLPGATGLRLAASLAELPAALHAQVHPGCPGVASPLGALGRTGLPLGRLARSDYERIAREQASDPWPALVLAWLSGPEAEPALARTLEVARASPAPDARRVELFAWEHRAWLLQSQQRNAEAQAAAAQALRLAAEAAAGTSAAPAPLAAQAALDRAYAGVAMARVLHAAGAPGSASQAIAESLPLLRSLAAARSEDLPVQVALLDALGFLASTQPGDGGQRFAAEAWARYQALQARTPYAPMRTAGTASGVILASVGFASFMTLLVGWALLRRYRQRVAALMRLAAGTRMNTAPAKPTMAPVEAALAQRTGDAIRAARRAQRHACGVQVVAGLAFGLGACWLQLHAYDTPANANRVLLMTWTWAWPTVLALGFLWDGDRPRQRLAWLAYFAGLLLVCTRIALGDTPALERFGIVLPGFVQALLFWVAALNFTPLLLLFMNRTLRSIGPALLALMLVSTAGGMLFLEAGGTPAGMRLTVAALSALHVPVEGALVALMLAGMVAFAPLAWLAGRLLRAAYDARWTSDLALVIDTVWLFQAALLALELSWTEGPAAIGWGLALFALYKAFALGGMWPVARAARRRPAVRLLLLRVFTRRDAQGRRTIRRSQAERLFDLLNSRWRYAGPIHLIGAPDLASSTLNPHTFLDFLAGRLRRRFVIEPADVAARLAALDERSDSDARWRINELFCGNDAWRPTVLALMERSDRVAMDLRDFRPDNDGCVFELDALVDLVPPSRIALFVDASTDRAFLEATIATRLHGRGDAAALQQMAFIDMGAGGERAAVDALLRLAAGPEGSASPSAAPPRDGLLPATGAP